MLGAQAQEKLLMAWWASWLCKGLEPSQSYREGCCNLPEAPGKLIWAITFHITLKVWKCAHIPHKMNWHVTKSGVWFWVGCQCYVLQKLIYFDFAIWVLNDGSNVGAVGESGTLTHYPKSETSEKLQGLRAQCPQHLLPWGRRENRGLAQRKRKSEESEL